MGDKKFTISWDIGFWILTHALLEKEKKTETKEESNIKRKNFRHQELIPKILHLSITYLFKNGNTSYSQTVL